MAIDGNNHKADTEGEGLTPLAQRFLWVENPEKVLFALKILAGLCVFLFLVDFIVHRHSYFSIEGWYGFYAFVGFIAFAFIVLAAKNLRKLILRDESYYSPNAVDAESYPEEGLEKHAHHDASSGGGLK